MTIMERLGIRIPLIQAPMAGISTPALAAAVTHAGALGAIAIGASDARGARAMIAELRALTSGPFNVNAFAHRTPRRDADREARWLVAMQPLFQAFGAEAPATLRAPYTSVRDDDELFRAVLDAAPAVVSVHFGLPTDAQIAALKQAGSVLIATATSLAEASAARAAGCDAVVAQGWEAGGHRGVFDPDAADERMDTATLTRLLVARAGVPVIAAGGIMDGRGIRAALALGAVAAQLGTAFIGCPESAADAHFRARLAQADAAATVVTRVISGRPARGLRNRFTAWGEGLVPAVPDYPIAYDAGKALAAAARAHGDHGYAAQWAGTGAAAARALPAAELVAVLQREMIAAN